MSKKVWTSASQYSVLWHIFSFLGTDLLIFVPISHADCFQLAQTGSDFAQMGIVSEIWQQQKKKQKNPCSLFPAFTATGGIVQIVI